MELLEVLGLRRGKERPEVYHDARLGALFAIAVLFAIGGLTKRHPSPGWLTVGCVSTLVAIACIYFATNRKAVVGVLFAFIALRGLIGFVFFKSYWALAVTLVCVVAVVVLRQWDQNSRNFLRK